MNLEPIVLHACLPATLSAFTTQGHAGDVATAPLVGWPGTGGPVDAGRLKAKAMHCLADPNRTSLRSSQDGARPRMQVPGKPSDSVETVPVTATAN